jgi:hypothetical protein
MQKEFWDKWSNFTKHDILKTLHFVFLKEYIFF